jgi:hypothetical protein
MCRAKVNSREMLDVMKQIERSSRGIIVSEKNTAF